MYSAYVNVMLLVSNPPNKIVIKLSTSVLVSAATCGDVPMFSTRTGKMGDSGVEEGVG